MAQNDPKLSTREAVSVPNPASGRGLALFAGSVSALALMAPLAATPSLARDYQVTTTQSGDNWTRTYRRIPSINYGVKSLPGGGAPGNNCPVPAFEVVNPRIGEVRCVGYVLPW